jgi:plasmid stabilization system protein ParE
VIDDFQLITKHMEFGGAGDAPQPIHSIIQAIDTLENHPLIGRKLGGGKRELLSGRDKRGYVALYRFLAPIDTVLVLAIRSQREVGSKR